MSFELGDEVSWESQSQGSLTTKIGVIVEVIASGVPVSMSIFKTMSNGAGPRNHESYVVCVVAKPGSRAQPKYYWPRVSALSLHKDK